MKRALVPLLSGALLAAAAPAAAEELSIPVTKTALPNGMTVLFHVDHTLPVVTVDTMFAVGSRMEPARRTGFAHLFEHLMFMGTRRVPTGKFDQWMEAAGGRNNADTGDDRTNYYDIAPPTALPLLLYLEADRLRDLGPLMTKEKLDVQKGVVRNERRQQIENQPYGVVDLKLPELLYPDNHPYHHPVIGSHEDLAAAQVGDVQDFFATWYDPANATLVVAGDFDPDATMRLVHQWFDGIPSRGKPRDPGAAGFDDTKTTLTGVVRATVPDRVELAKVIMAWQTPKHFAPGDAELDILATLLAQGKASRLYKALVYDLKLAQSVDATQEQHDLGSRFVIDVTARPGVDLGALEKAIDAEVDKLRKAPPSDEELTRAKNLTETAFVSALQSIPTRAELLAMYQRETGDPSFFAKDLARYRAATAQGVEDAVTKYLVPDKRVILEVVPKEEGR